MAHGRRSWPRLAALVAALTMVASGLISYPAAPPAQAAPAGGVSAADLPEQEPGVTRRSYDLGYGLTELCELKAGQTPNADDLMPVIDWSTTEDFGLANNFLTEALANLRIEAEGSYEFELTSDDGSDLLIDDELVIDHDGQHAASAKTGSVELTAGYHTLRVNHFDSGGGKRLLLRWKQPGDSAFTVVPQSVLSVDAGVVRVTAPGPKECVGGTDSPGDGLQLNAVNPNYTLTNLRPDGFEPWVTGLEWHGTDLLVSTWGGENPSGDDFTDRGELYRLTGVQEATSPAEVEATLVAEALNEPMGLKVVDGDVYVAEKDRLSRLIDADGDGTYEDSATVAEWPYGGNFHEFAFGPLYKDGYFYLNLSVAIDFGGMTTAPQPGCPTEPCRRGTTLKIDKDTGEIEYLAGGLRTPNGIGWGPEGGIFATDNQGSWLPANKLVQIKPGRFFNHYTDPAGQWDDEPVTQPVLWLPQNEIANSPTTPVMIPSGPFEGQMWIGDITYGGIQRAYLEKVGGEFQGAVFRMTQGLEVGINRLLLGPDGTTIYAGGLGAGGNWGQEGKLQHGLQKLTLKPDANTFEMQSMSVVEGGFEVTYTQPLGEEALTELASKYRLKQWTYQPTQQYGGPKVDEEELTVTSAEVTEDHRTVTLMVDGLKPGRVVHLRSPRPFASAEGETLWNTEAWYTLNSLPGYVPPPAPRGLHEFEEGVLTGGARVDTEHAGFSGTGFVSGFGTEGASAEITVRDAEAGAHQLEIGYANGPHPFQGTKQVSLYVNGERRPLALPSTGTWATYGHVAVPVQLDAGENSIAVRYDAGDDGHVNLDYALVTPEEGDLYEAEEAILADGAQPDSEHPGHTGDGYVAGYWNEGASTTFRLTTQRAADYPFRLRYSNGPDPFEGAKTVSLYVNGSRTAQLSLPSTGTWQEWGTLSGSVPLPEGENRISVRYDAGDDGNVNLDHLRVGPAAARSCDGTTPPNDEFAGDELDRCRWTTLLNEDPSGYEVADGALAITAEDGDIFGQTFSPTNVVLQPAPGDGSWSATTQVALDGTDDYLQAGLVAYSSDTDHAKLVLMRTPEGQWVAELGRTTGGNTTYSNVALPDGANTGTRLRLTMNEGRVTGEVAVGEDGAWEPVGAGFPASGLDNPLVGLAAYNGTGAEVARFDSFAVGDAAETPETCDPTAADAGYTMLFDGTRDSLAEWSMAGPGGFARTSDCTLVSQGGLGLLWHPEPLSGDYSLKLDWMMPGDENSGVFVGFPDPGGDPWVAVEQGHEIQIDPSDDPSHTTGSVYGFQSADAEARDAALNPHGEWNSYELVVHGDRIQVYLNDVLINDYTDTDPERMNHPSFIGLQNHGAGDEVYFRNVQVADGLEPESTVTLAPEASSLTVGDKTLVEVTVASNGDTVPTGEVTLAADGGDPVPVELEDGAARFRVGPMTAPGTVEITAVYGGDDETPGSETSSPLTVTRSGNRPPESAPTPPVVVKPAD